MDLEKLSERVKGVVQAAQGMALARDHQRFTPEHLLKVLIDDKEGMAAGLAKAAGADVDRIKVGIEAELAKIPQVKGTGAGQLYLTPETARLFEQAVQIAEKAGDSFVTVERLLLALLLAEGTPSQRVLKEGGLTAQNLNRAIEDVRKGRKADTASAESGYDALKKYARDLTQAARDGKIDPVIGRDEEVRRTIQVLSRRT